MGSPQFPRGNYSAAQPFDGLQAQPYGGLQPDYSPQAVPMLGFPIVYSGQPVIHPREKTVAIIFIIFAVIIIVLSVIDIELNFWIYLCGANIGLTHITYLVFTGSISEAKDFFCGNSSNLFELCSGMCSNLQHLQTAGSVTQGMSITAIVCTGICILLMLLLLLRPSGHRLKGVIVRVAVITTAVVWIVGAVVYVGYYVNVANNTSDSSWSIGLVLAMVIIVLQVINCMLGNKAVTKLMR